MCVTNIYRDVYPDGKEASFQQTQFCQFSHGGRPCPIHSTLSNPVRKIQYHEPTTEYIMTLQAQQRHQQAQQAQQRQQQSLHPQHHAHPSNHRPFVQFPSTPPRSRGGSHSRELTPPGGERVPFRRRSKRVSAESPLRPALKAHREHHKERIVIVDAPPTPRTPPMHFTQTFTAPSSPATPPYIVEGGFPRRERGRPVIVDERPMRREREKRDSSREAVIGIGERVVNTPSNRRRARSQDRGVFQWDSPSSSHTSFDSRARRETEEAERLARERREEQERLLARERRREAEEAERRRERERDARIEALEAERRREARIREADEEIRRRPAVPMAPSPLRRRESIRERERIVPIVDQSPSRLREISRTTSSDRGRLTVGELALREEAEIRRRMAERDREVRLALEKKVEEEELKQRLRERQMPIRRFSVGPGGRRHRVLYDDGVYRWE